MQVFENLCTRVQLLSLVYLLLMEKSTLDLKEYLHFYKKCCTMYA